MVREGVIRALFAWTAVNRDLLIGPLGGNTENAHGAGFSLARIDEGAEFLTILKQR